MFFFLPAPTIVRAAQAIKFGCYQPLAPLLALKFKNRVTRRRLGSRSSVFRLIGGLRPKFVAKAAEILVSADLPTDAGAHASHGSGRVPRL
ncbi:hypothetical protein K438DRAFT_556294 [Mycena galopus ATCC 62051]|nr:hypothetical protein K438DRAFT_556294 [Mycena galopus ATCC 62051]